MSAAREVFVRDMTEWLNMRFAGLNCRFDAGTPLFATGLIDSLRVLELIAYTEEAIGSVIPDVRIRMDNFQSVSRIAEVFLEETSDAAA